MRSETAIAHPWASLAKETQAHRKGRQIRHLEEMVRLGNLVFVLTHPDLVTNHQEKERCALLQHLEETPASHPGEPALT